MTSQSGGSVNGYPGVASDGASGLIADGGIQVNGADTVDAPGDGTPYSALTGYTALRDAPENVTNGWQTLIVNQEQPLTGDNPAPVVTVDRSGTLNGHAYTSPAFVVRDDTAGTADLYKGQSSAGNVFFVNHAGGVGQYGHTPPTAQPAPTIATSTITDAVAKAAIKALILIINNSGEAAITET